MKQQFRDKIPKGKMRTKYWIDKSTGTYDYWETTAETLTSQVVDIVDYYISIGIKLTNRQLYYQLVGKDFIPNVMEVYKRICSFLTDLRYAGIIDWDAIEDKSRVPKKPNDWENISSIIRAATHQYRLPRWADQKYYIEMYCEKEAGVNVLEVISEKYHTYFGFNKGYSSAAAMYNLAQRVGKQIEKDKEVIILYFGDHDPSGLDMIRDITDRITEFLGGGITDEDERGILEDEFWETEHQNPESEWYESYEEDWRPYFEEEWLPEHLGKKSTNFKVVPVSLTMDQIKKYNLPPNFAKVTDPRAKWYIKQFGKISWELDAIDAIELRRIAEDAVLEYIDMKKYNAWIKREQKEIKALSDFGDTLK